MATGPPVSELPPRMKSLLDCALRISPLQVAFRADASRRLAVLAYHAIEDRTRFARHIAYLRRVRHPVSLSDVLDHLDGGRALPSRPALVTFDDGHPSVLDVALPVLTSQGVAGVAFVVSGRIGTTEPFWWDEVEALVGAGGVVRSYGELSAAQLVRRLKTLEEGERVDRMSELRASVLAPITRVRQLTAEELRTLDAGGIRVESHSVSHPCLTRCDDERVTDELSGSRKTLEEILDRPVEAFAYPDGVADTRIVREVGRAGYRVAFLFDHRVCPSSGVDRHRVSRVRANSAATLNRVAVLLSGLHPALHHARGRS